MMRKVTSVKGENHHHHHHHHHSIRLIAICHLTSKTSEFRSNVMLLPMIPNDGQYLKTTGSWPPPDIADVR